VFVAGLFAVVVLHLLTEGDVLSGAAAPGVALAVALAATALYARAAVLRTLVSVLTPAPFLFAALFLFTSPASELVFATTPEVHAAEVRARTPVVLVVLDEASTVSLMDGRQRIDARRFPHFAALARDATWFRNATTEYWLTEGAVPSVMTGQTPKPTRLPIFAHYPQNIFTLLGKGYRMRAVESLTTLCPRSLCREKRAARARAVEGTASSLLSDAGIVYLHLVVPEPYDDRVPAIDDSWGNFGRRGEAEEPTRRRGARALQPCARNVCELTRLIDRDRRPTLYFLHTLLPHVPYVYLPSGRRYAVDAPVLHGLRNGRWHDRAGALHSYQRYLLQLAYTDRALGLVMSRLRAAGVYGRALVIVTADHGVSFRMGEPRRLATKRNLDDIAFVPMFVKLPGQTRGRVVDSAARTIDVVPTIAKVLGIRPAWHLDGRPLVGRARTGDETVFVITGRNSRVSAPLSELVRRRTRALGAQIRTFGTGSLENVYRLGPERRLVGRRTADLPVRPSAGRVELEGGSLLSAVDPASDLLPTYLEGRVRGLSPRPGVLAFAVNGRVVATTATLSGGRDAGFAALVPESAVHAGRNALEVFAVRGSGRTVRLRALRGGTRGAVLVRRGGAEVLDSTGFGLVNVRPQALRGELSVSRTGTGWAFSGWAADLRARRAATTFFVLAGGREVFRTRASLVRPHRILGEQAVRKAYGFRFELPASLLPAAGGDAVRFLAVRGRVASEPRYAGAYPWPTD
jgi:hypothetical protein